MKTTKKTVANSKKAAPLPERMHAKNNLAKAMKPFKK